MNGTERQIEVVRVNQIQLAEILGINNKTLNTYLLEGMPCQSRESTGIYSFDLVLCLYWENGREIARKQGFQDLPTLAYVLTGYLVALEHESSRFWLPIARNLADRLGIASESLYFDCLAAAICLSGRTGGLSADSGPCKGCS